MGKFRWVKRLVPKRFRKNPEKKARGKIIKLCRESKAVKLKEHDGSTKSCYSVSWYNQVKELTWGNLWAAQYVVGTLQNAQKRGLVGVESRIEGHPTILSIDEASAEIRARGRSTVVFFPKRPWMG